MWWYITRGGGGEKWPPTTKQVFHGASDFRSDSDPKVFSPFRTLILILKLLKATFRLHLNTNGHCSKKEREDCRV